MSYFWPFLYFSFVVVQSVINCRDVVRAKCFETAKWSGLLPTAPPLQNFVLLLTTLWHQRDSHASVALALVEAAGARVGVRSTECRRSLGWVLSAAAL